MATIITMVLAVILGVVAGYFRGITDGFVNRGLDIIWAFPAVLLGLDAGHGAGHRRDRPAQGHER